MNIVYYHNYSEFNVKYIKMNQVEPWKRALEDCLKKTSYFTDSRRYIALTHFESCKPVIQDYLRVILETNPLTTFILFTTRYHAVREALRSRCIAIRIPYEPTIPLLMKLVHAANRPLSDRGQAFCALVEEEMETFRAEMP